MVTMAPKLTFGPAVADWQEGINVPRMREQRAERARQAMRRHGIPALLATDSVPGHNIRYLTGLRVPDFIPQLSYVLFFAEHDPVVFAHAGAFQQMPDQAPWVKSWRIGRSWLGGICGPEATREEAMLFASEVYQELRERGLARERLAVIGFDDIAKEALRELGIGLVDGWPMMLEARAVKTGDEINCLKTAAAICGAAYYRVWQNLRPGLTETAVVQMTLAALYEAGAEEARSNCHSGPLSFERGLALTGRRIEWGDLLYVAMCRSSFIGYRACQYRTFIIGRKPNDREKDWFKQMKERLDRAIEAVKPGATTADAAKHFPPASSWGYKEEAEVLTVEIGHGVGLHLYELPVINRQWSLKHPQVFEPGVVFAIECLEGEHRVGGVRLENMVVVTQDGAEIIDHFPRDEILVAGAL